MLLATPFMHLDKVLTKDGPPRIISEVKKTHVGISRELNRPKLNGDLLVKCGNDQQWWPRRVTIRGGQLLVGSVHGESKYGSVKIPLRKLSLSAGKLPNTLSLIRGQNILLTIQTPSEKTFDLWVKAIAVELIRQTPLEDVKYFDILTIDDSWKAKLDEKQRDWNFNCLKENVIPIQITEKCNSCSAISTPNPETHLVTKTPTYLLKIESYPISLTETPSRYKRSSSALKNAVPYSSQRSQVHARSVEKIPLRVRSRSCNSVPKDEDREQDINSNYIDKQPMTVTFDNTNGKKTEKEEETIEVLLKKCQNHENYVPVKEKLLLFETLCRLGRKVRSTENVNVKVDIGTKRARSLHDLHRVNNAGVKQMCRYFENKCETQNCDKYDDMKKDKRLIYSDSSLNTIQKFRYSRIHNASYA